MPSYANDVKSELARKFDDDTDCLRAELIAILRVGANINGGRIEFSSANAAVVRKVITLLKRVYPDAQKEVAAIRTKKFLKTMRYFVRIFQTAQTAEIFNLTNSLEVTRRQRAKIAYLRGAFIANGTVNRPEKQYYLEISSTSEMAAEFVHKLFNYFEFNSTFRFRKDTFVVHMSEGDSILDFLGMIGVSETIERFESARNLKEIRANVNRLINCETANLNKAIDTAQRQIADIKTILQHKIRLTDELQIAMDMRLKYPECTIGELAEKIFITRPGLMYRFKVLHQLAEDIRNK